MKTKFVPEMAEEPTDHAITLNQAISAAKKRITFIFTFERKPQHPVIEFVHFAVNFCGNGAKAYVTSAPRTDLDFCRSAQISIIGVELL